MAALLIILFVINGMLSSLLRPDPSVLLRHHISGIVYEAPSAFYLPPDAEVCMGQRKNEKEDIILINLKSQKEYTIETIENYGSYSVNYFGENKTLYLAAYKEDGCNCVIKIENEAIVELFAGDYVRQIAVSSDHNTVAFAGISKGKSNIQLMLCDTTSQKIHIEPINNLHSWTRPMWLQEGMLLLNSTDGIIAYELKTRVTRTLVAGGMRHFVRWQNKLVMQDWDGNVFACDIDGADLTFLFKNSLMGGQHAFDLKGDYLMGVSCYISMLDSDSVFQSGHSVFVVNLNTLKYSYYPRKNEGQYAQFLTWCK